MSLYRRVFTESRAARIERARANRGSDLSQWERENQLDREHHDSERRSADKRAVIARREHKARKASMRTFLKARGDFDPK